MKRLLGFALAVVMLAVSGSSDAKVSWKPPIAPAPVPGGCGYSPSPVPVKLDKCARAVCD